MDPTLGDAANLPMLLPPSRAWAAGTVVQSTVTVPRVVQLTSSAVTCGGPVDATFSFLSSSLLKKIKWRPQSSSLSEVVCLVLVF